MRIFVRYSRVPEAMKAVVALDGRTFAGRCVSACFYDERRYDLSELARDPTSEPELPSECRRVQR